MKIKGFIKEFNGCPIDYAELASWAVKVGDSPLLVKLANDLIQAQDQFESYVMHLGVELG